MKKVVGIIIIIGCGIAGWLYYKNTIKKKAIANASSDLTANSNSDTPEKPAPVQVSNASGNVTTTIVEAAPSTYATTAGNEVQLTSSGIIKSITINYNGTDVKLSDADMEMLKDFCTLPEGSVFIVNSRLWIAAKLLQQKGIIPITIYQKSWSLYIAKVQSFSDLLVAEFCK